MTPHKIVDGHAQYLTPEQRRDVLSAVEETDRWREPQAAERHAAKRAADSRPSSLDSAPTGLVVDQDERKTDQTRRFPGLSHTEALAVTVKPSRQLVRGLIGAGTPGTVAGLPGSHKSWLAMQIGYAVAGAGGRVLGHEVVEQGPVAYWWQDDSDDEEFGRLQAYAKRHDLTSDLPITWHVNEGLQLPRDLDVLRDEVTIRGQILVVLDSLYNFTAAGVVLKDEVVADLIKAIKSDVCDQTGCTVMFVDHSAWPTEANRGTRAYGSVFKTAAIRWGIYLKATNGKISYEAHGNNMPRTRRTPLMWDGDALRLGVVDDAKAKKAPAGEIADWLKSLNPPVATPKQIRERFDIGDDTLRNRRAELVDLGVSYVDQGAQSHYAAADELVPRDDAKRGAPRGAAYPASDLPRGPAPAYRARGAPRGREQGVEDEDGGW